jgi:hypothetical protein
MNWKLEFTEKNEHRIFSDEQGRLSVADRSGVNPSLTEDGALYINPNSVATIRVNEGRVFFTLPVNGEGQFVSVSMKCYKFLREKLNLSHKLTGDLKALVEMGAN